MADKDLLSVGAKSLAQMSPIGIGVSAAQGALGIAQMVSGSINQKKWLKQLKAFQTPEEVGKMLNLTQNMAQQGYDAFTLDYLTNNIDRAADASLGAATRLGADPNQLGDILDQRIQGLMRVGAENHNLNMQNIAKYMGALEVVGKNKEAEWASQQDIVKQNLQKSAQDKQAGLGNIAGAANNLISMEASKNAANLYLDKQRAALPATDAVNLGQQATPSAAAGVGGVVNSGISMMVGNMLSGAFGGLNNYLQTRTPSGEPAAATLPLTMPQLPQISKARRK